MKISILIVCVLICFANLEEINGTGIINVTYQELKELNVTCPPYDTCLTDVPRINESLTINLCNCDTSCAFYGTCCVDSRNKHIPAPSIKPTCRHANASSGYLMIDQCPESGESKSAYEDLCREEWNGQNKIMRLVPVTSLFTNITYKNIFCFRCHEVHDDFVFWIFRTENQTQSPAKENAHVRLEYDMHKNTWIAPLEQGGAFVPVSFPEFRAPTEIFGVPRECILGIISNCSENWEDGTVRAKCDVYMAMTLIKRDGITWKYRNPHCAICNFEDMNNFICRSKYPIRSGSSQGRERRGSGGSHQRSHLFTLRTGFDLSDQGKLILNKMCGGSEVWDPYMKKCRTLRCLLPGHVLKEGKCTAP